MKALRALEKRQIQEALIGTSPCFTRSFVQQQQTTAARSLSPGGSPRPESSSSDPGNDLVFDWMMMEANPTYGGQQDSGVCLFQAYSDGDNLSQMLEELRNGTEELEF